MRALGGCLAIVLVAAACGDRTTDTVPGGEQGDASDPPISDVDYPPDVTVTGGGTELALRPWAFCWVNGCVDGVPPEPLADVGSAEELIVTFPAANWAFEASVRRADDPCARAQTADLERLSETEHRLEPLGAAGDYDVELFGRGDGTGDVVVSFRWTTPSDGPPPEPEAWLAVLAQDDEDITSYGVEMSVTNLASSPDEVTADITVTAAGGEQLTFQPRPASLAPQGCDVVEGQLWWDGPDAAGFDAAALGAPPFTYTIRLTLDGSTHIGTASWPDDEVPDHAPSVPVVFEPPLPALGSGD